MKGFFIPFGIILLLTASIQAGDPLFYDPVSYPAGSWPLSTALADFNNDGWNDMAVTNGSTGITFLYNNGDGTFGAPQLFCTYCFLEADPIIAHDFDNSGTMDLAVGDYGGSTITVFLSDQNGNFSEFNRRWYPVGGKPSSLCAAGFSSVNQFDIAVVCKDDRKVYILVNNGDGTFQNPVACPAGSGNTSNAPPKLCALDCDLDNDPDLAVTGFSEHSITILSNDGYGNFAIIGGLGSNESLLDIDASDLDHVFGPDIIALNWRYHFDTYLKIGNDLFSSQPISYEYYAFISTSLIAKDFNHDGYSDVALTCDLTKPDAKAIVFLNNQSGILSLNHSYSVNWLPFSIASADLNNDHSNDLVTLSSQGNVQVFLNKLSFNYVCGDANGDGGVNVGDAVYIINYVFRGGPPPDPYYSGDANGDCFVDLADAVYLIGYIFKGGSEPLCMNCSGTKPYYQRNANSNCPESQEAILAYEYDGEGTTFELRSSVDIHGLQIKTTGRVEPDAILCNNMQIFTNNPDAHSSNILLIDMNGHGFISAGNTILLEAQGNIKPLEIAAFDHLGTRLPVKILNLTSSEALPAKFRLYQNNPNPFNPGTGIPFSLPVATDVRLEVYNIAGQVVETLVDGYLEAGTHVVTWDGSKAGSGIYFYRINAGEFSDSKKMVLLK